MLNSSTIESPWHSYSLNPQIIIDFNKHVTILDVVLKPAFVIAKAQSKLMKSSVEEKVQSDDSKASFKNIR